MVICTKCLTTMITATTISCVRKHHVIRFVVTNPFVATVGFSQVLCLTAETAFRFCFCRHRLICVIFLANGDVVAPARSSADFKKDVAAGCHSRLDREKESRMWLKLETRRRLGGTQATTPARDSAKTRRNPSTQPQPETRQRLGGTQAHNPSRRLCGESNTATAYAMVFFHDRHSADTGDGGDRRRSYQPSNNLKI
jgi:hypothetical protein